jgi:hypothetical protein
MSGPLNSSKPPTSEVVGAVYNVTPPAPSDGQPVALQTDSAGNLKVNVIAGGTGGGNVNITQIGGVNESIANPLPVELSDGTNPFGTSANPITVNANAGTGTFTVGGTVNIPSTNSAVTSWGLGATAAAVPSGAQQIGGRASSTIPTAVTDGQLVGLMADILGKLVVRVGASRQLIVQNTITLTTTTETTLLTAGAAGVFLDLTMLIISNTSATAVRVDIRDATAGTVRMSLYAPAGQTIGFTHPVTFTQTTAANNWTAQLSAAVTDVRVLAQAIQTA